MSASNYTEIWRIYGDAFRKDAHQLLLWGYRDVRPNINCENEETEITGFIVDAIEKRLDDPTIDERFDRYEVFDDSPFTSESRIGKKRRRVDIKIKCNISKPRLRYIFEAKRLCKYAPINNYFGSEGIQRFINEVYASEYPEVAMIGYVQDLSIIEWEKNLQDKFSEDKEKIQATKMLSQFTIISNLSNTWISEHMRVSGKALTIFHILLDCT